jgi:hypothetical protein
MNTYIAHYTDTKTFRAISLPVTAIDYVTAVQVAKRLLLVPAYMFYTFDGVTFK